MNKVLEAKVNYIIAIGHDLILYQKKNKKRWLEHIKKEIDVVIHQRKFLLKIEQFNPNDNARMARDYLTKLLVDLEHFKDMNIKIPQPDGPFNFREYSIKGKNTNTVVRVDYTPINTIMYEPLYYTYKNQIKEYDIICLIQEVLISLKIKEYEVKQIIEDEFDGKVIKKIEPKYKVIITTTMCLSLPLETIKKEANYKVYIDYKAHSSDKVQIFTINDYKDLCSQLIKAPHPFSHNYTWTHLLNDFYDKLS